MGDYVRVPLSVISSKELSVYAKTTYAVLLHLANDGKTVKAGRYVIAEYLNVSVRTLDIYLKELSLAGLIRITRRGYKMSNVYELLDVCFSASNECKNTTTHKDSVTTNECKDTTTLLLSQDDVNTNECQNTALLYNKSNIGSKDNNKESKEKRYAPSAKAKRMSHADLAERNIAEALAGSREWKDVTDRDFTLFYIAEHNKLFSYPIVFNMYRDVSIMRDAVINANGLQRSELVQFIKTMLNDYSLTPNRYDRLSLNMLSNRNRDIVALIDSVKAKIRPAERKYSYNSFNAPGDKKDFNNDGMSF